MNPWVLFAAAMAVGGAFFYGMDVGADREIAKQKTTQELVDAVYDKAQKGAADSIAAMEIKNVTITQPIRTEVRTRTVYAECKHTPDGLRALNAAVTGRAEPIGQGELPRADPAPPRR
ncbi:hypothetical protein [Hydrogenophaga sp.]